MSVTETRERGRERPASEPTPSGLELLMETLAWLDERLEPLVTALRAEAGADDDPGLRGLVVTDAEVARLLRAPGLPAGTGAALPGVAGALWRRVEPELARAGATGRIPPLERLRRTFDLSPFEMEAVLVCLATELDSKYEKLFGFLNDDVTRRFPSVQLLLRLLGGAGEPILRRRRYLLPDAALFRCGILAWVDDGRSWSAVAHLGRCVRTEDGVVRFLLEEPGCDPELARLGGTVRTGDASAAEDEPARAIARFLDREAAGDRVPGGGRGRVCGLVGRRGSGRGARVAAELARRGQGLLALDARRLLAHEHPERVLLLALRDAALHNSALLLTEADGLGEGERGARVCDALARLLDTMGGAVFVSVAEAGQLRRWLPRHVEREVVIPSLTREQSVTGWQERLPREPGEDCAGAESLAESLASRFRLTPGQMDAACRLAAARADGAETANGSALHRAAAEVGAPDLVGVAQKLEPVYSWDDLVLPAAAMELLRDAARRVRHRRQVLEEWGFGATLSRNRGLTLLFSGPSGTGKTMAAEVLAKGLELDLYRIDLAGVVSKYIGETEKNLSRIFREAENADVILFFDEADALFGKRSEVKDAHDRYANIEVNYLMQQIESYEGISVLATNFRQNMDDAFLRRIQIAIEFPMPSADDRLRIWDRVLPADAPQAENLDLPFLARTFDVSGGNIRNIALAAAFLAADERSAIGMSHLVRATQRELEKIGRRTLREEFGPYFFLLERPAARAAGG